MSSSRVFHNDVYDLFIYHHDHMPPHLHYVSSEFGAVFSITTGNMIVGTVAKKKHIKEVHDWIMVNRDGLMVLWDSRG